MDIWRGNSGEIENGTYGMFQVYRKFVIDVVLLIWCPCNNIRMLSNSNSSLWDKTRVSYVNELGMIASSQASPLNMVAYIHIYIYTQYLTWRCDWTGYNVSIFTFICNFPTINENKTSYLGYLLWFKSW